MRNTLIVIVALTAAPALAQDWVAGVEATTDTSYTYVTHYSRSGSILIWQTVSYLRYSTRDGGSDTQVHSPGISTGAMYRWSRGSTSGGFGAGYEMRWTERRPTGAPPVSQREQGPIVEADLTQRLAARTSGRVAARWSSANVWRAASAELRYEIRPTLRVGPQVVYQGNDDVEVLSAGGVVEIPRGPSALQFRGGVARVNQRDGTTRTQPYFSVGIGFAF